MARSSRHYNGSADTPYLTYLTHLTYLTYLTYHLTLTWRY